MLLQPGETYEALDDNEVALQNMMGNRFMGFFEAQVLTRTLTLTLTLPLALALAVAPALT